MTLNNITNYESIKNMSVEEFAEYVFLNLEDERDLMYVFGSWLNKQQLKEWLNSEVIQCKNT